VSDIVIEVRPRAPSDRDWATKLERDTWGEPLVARRGELVDPTALPGFVAVVDGEKVGLVTYAVRGDECEVVSIRSLREGVGVGRALLDAVRESAVAARCRRLWLITTNNNVRALAVYQRWGLDVVAFYRDAVTESRRHLKPSIPERDEHGIPIRHELELELLL
jgi:ribosomal protein S18 acetylase RimI-like enzyme